jgi:Zn-finger nucleic acid-binding protein
MPLLTCPNDESPMTTVERSGVQFDMCPTCRGVWLDRGELEKLMAASRDEAAPAAAQPPPSAWREPPRPEPRRYERDDDDYRRYGHHKKKRFDLFDIFD